MIIALLKLVYCRELFLGEQGGPKDLVFFLGNNFQKM